MKYIFGNWKMNGLGKEAFLLAQGVAMSPVPENAKAAIFPPFTSLHIAREQLKGSKIHLGAQDCSAEKSGAYTGDISAAMLKDTGCEYVLVGHSERRTLHGEKDDMIRRKALAAIAAGLKPVICVGENLAERESGNYLQIITNQAKNSLPSLTHSHDFLIAYEPVWAIGSGKTPTIAEISEVHKTIASLLYHDTSVSGHSVQTAVLYGGSVKAANAGEIMETQGVDGVLVGGASLNADEFGKIIAEMGNLCTQY